MLGGSPRGGDGTNVVLNEGSARRLGGLYSKGIPVVVACGVRPVYSPRFGGSPEPKIFGRWLVAWATAAVATAAVALRAEVSRACAAQAAFAP